MRQLTVEGKNIMLERSIEFRCQRGLQTIKKETNLHEILEHQNVIRVGTWKDNLIIRFVWHLLDEKCHYVMMVIELQSGHYLAEIRPCGRSSLLKFCSLWKLGIYIWRVRFTVSQKRKVLESLKKTGFANFTLF